MISPKAAHQKGHEFLFPPWSANLPSRPERKSVSVLCQTRCQEKRDDRGYGGFMVQCLKTTKGGDLCSSRVSGEQGVTPSKEVPDRTATVWTEMSRA